MVTGYRYRMTFTIVILKVDKDRHERSREKSSLPKEFMEVEHMDALKARQRSLERDIRLSLEYSCLSDDEYQQGVDGKTGNTSGRSKPRRTSLLTTKKKCRDSSQAGIYG